LRARSASSQTVQLASFLRVITDCTGCDGVIDSPVARGGAAELIRQTFQALAECFLNRV